MLWLAWGAAFEPFGGGDVLEAAGLAVRPFRTSHDAADSYGFRFDELTGASEGCDSLGYMTDTGIVTDKAWEALSGVRLLALESNHDARMLEVGPYPYVIKQRIASARGHLSNDQAREALDNLAHENLRAVGGHARLPGEQHLPAPARDLRGRHRRARPFHDRSPSPSKTAS